MTGPSSERTADAVLIEDALIRAAAAFAIDSNYPLTYRDEMRDALAALDRLVARNQQLQEALAALLEWAEKDKGGYQFSDPSEEWYAIRDYARAALASVRARSET